MFELGILMLVALAVAIACTVAVLAKLVLWAILLPFRILFWTVAGILSLPLVVAGVALGGALLVLALPVLLVAIAGAVLVGLLVPLVPLLLLAGLIWLLLATPSGAAAPR